MSLFIQGGSARLILASENDGATHRFVSSWTATLFFFWISVNSPSSDSIFVYCRELVCLFSSIDRPVSNPYCVYYGLKKGPGSFSISSL